MYIQKECKMEEIERIIDDFYNKYEEGLVNLEKGISGFYLFTKGVNSHAFILSNELIEITKKYRQNKDFRIFISLIKYMSLTATVYAPTIDMESFRILRTYLKNNCRIVLDDVKIEYIFKNVFDSLDPELYPRDASGIKLTTKGLALLRRANDDFTKNGMEKERAVLHELSNLYFSDKTEFKIFRNQLDTSIIKIWTKCHINKG